MIYRRQFLAGLTGALALPRMAMSRQSSGITKINDTLSLLTGVGTNVLALSTSDGMILVDSGAPQYGAALMAATEDLEVTVDALIELARSRGAHDNVSIVLADVIA